MNHKPFHLFIGVFGLIIVSAIALAAISTPQNVAAQTRATPTNEADATSTAVAAAATAAVSTPTSGTATSEEDNQGSGSIRGGVYAHFSTGGANKAIYLLNSKY